MSGRRASRDPAPRQGASNAEAAAHFGTTERNITRWRQRGWTVHLADGSIDLAATAARVADRRDGRGRPSSAPPATAVTAPPAGAPATPEDAQAAADEARALPTELAGVTLEEARRRKEFWLSERARLEVARVLGAHIPLAEAQRVYVAKIVAAKASLDAFIVRAAPRLVGLTSEREVRSILRAELDDALRSLPDDPPDVE